jgi:hypothetical protein
MQNHLGQDTISKLVRIYWNEILFERGRTAGGYKEDGGGKLDNTSELIQNELLERRLARAELEVELYSTVLKKSRSKRAAKKVVVIGEYNNAGRKQLANLGKRFR